MEWWLEAALCCQGTWEKRAPRWPAPPLHPADFFITMLNTNMLVLTVVAWVIYLASFFFFSIWYYVIMTSKPDCLYGATTYVECWTLSFVTQMTIGARQQPEARKERGTALGCFAGQPARAVWRV